MLRAMTKCCGTCKHLLVHPDRDGKIRVRKDRFYPCQFDARELVKKIAALLPTALRNAYYWRMGLIHTSANFCGQADPTLGEDCPVWEPRKE